MSEQAHPESLQQDFEEMAAGIIDLWRSGNTLAQTMGITDEECEAMYAYGHSLYALGKYEDALKIFARLVTYDHMDSRYQMALASAMQMTGRYLEALQQYMVVAVMRVDDPVPVFHSAECLLALGRSEEARDSLELVTETLCMPGKDDVIKSRAQALLLILGFKSK